MRYDTLSLGPARMDVFIKLPDDQIEETCSIDRKKCMISLAFGEKIPIQSINFAVGGNTGNNAVGLVRLGHVVAMAGTMGDQWTDKQAMEMLKSEGVETKYICFAQGKAGFGVVLNYAEERTILSYYPKAECSFPTEPDLEANWLYLTTAGEDYEEFYRQAVGAAEKWGARIAFNPGSRQIKAGLSMIKFVVEKTEVMFVNKEEAAHLLGKQVDADVKELLAGLLEVGAKVAVITNGPDGTYLFDGQKYLYMPIVPAPVVERTGAGDAFGSGFLAAIMHGKSYEEALWWGTCNSGSVLGYIGPQKGLLNMQQMQEWLEKSKDVQPREI
ncbi:MAG: putative Ribokinase [Microgenomates group bacterium Gr01-1014_16]|nr:MAG: putative Ribokinase [Microgenomates group bacterium Gr01-1014_16]